LVELRIGAPPGKGFKGLYQSCLTFIVGLKDVAVKLTIVPPAKQLTDVVAGETVLLHCAKMLNDKTQAIKSKCIFMLCDIAILVPKITG
jgi:hypothetical protein